MTQFSIEDAVGDIVAQKPSSSQAFYRYNIDFCCGGGSSLSKACKKAGIDPEEVLQAVNQVDASADANLTNWKEVSLTGVIGHILSEYHEPLRIELNRLDGMLEKVTRVHGHVDEKRFEALGSVFTAFKAELLSHMQKEEEILFPLIMQGRGQSCGMPIQVMEHEHQEAGNALEQLRELTDDYTPPEYACNTWRALWNGFEMLEKQMHRHIHLENNILFPRTMNLSNMGV